MTMDRFTHLRQMGYEGTEAEMLTKYVQDITGLDTIGEALQRALDQPMAQQIIGINPSGGSLVDVPAGLQASGVPSSTNFLRGDGTWAVPAGGGGGGGTGTDPNAVHVTGDYTVNGNITFTGNVDVIDNTLDIPDVAGLQAALTLKANADNATHTGTTTFTGPVAFVDGSIAQVEVANLTTDLAARVLQTTFDSTFALSSFTIDVFCPSDVDQVRPSPLAPTSRVRWHKQTRPIFGGAYAQSRDSWVKWSG